MKIYTEEQVKRHKEILEDIIDLWDNGFPLDSNTITKCENYLSELTPIELPSDEEMSKEEIVAFPKTERYKPKRLNG